MAPIRNVAFAQGSQAANADLVIYTVPTGYALILKSVLLRSQAGPSIGFQVQLANANANVLAAAGQTDANGAYVWEGWTVLNAGDEILLVTGASAFWYWFAGALLPHAPGY